MVKRLIFFIEVMKMTNETKVQIWHAMYCAYNALEDVILIGWNPAFDESFLVRAISHEILHRVLYKEVSEEACRKLDNIWLYCDLALLDINYEAIAWLSSREILRMIKIYCDEFKW